MTDSISRLPDVRRQADGRVSDLRVKLRKLGEPPDTRATTKVLTLVRSLNSDLEGMIKGSDIDVYDSNVIADAWWETKRTFIQANRKRYTQFKQEIRQTAPQFIPRLSQDSKESLDGISDVEDDDTVHEEGSLCEGKTYNLNDVRGYIEKYVVLLVSKFSGIRLRSFLRLLCWEFPNEVPRRVKRELIKEFTQMWKGPTENCFDFVATSLKTALDHLIAKHFTEFPKLLEHLEYAY